MPSLLPSRRTDACSPTSAATTEQRRRRGAEVEQYVRSERLCQIDLASIGGSSGPRFKADSSESSGRMPRMIDWPDVVPHPVVAREVVVDRQRCSPKATETDRLPSSRASTMFIAGEPMKPATNRSPGACRASRCVDLLQAPVAMTAIRSPIVIASTWSWVT